MFTRAVCAVALASAAAVNAAASLSLKVDAPATVAGVDNLVVHTTITNTGDEKLKLLKDPRSVLNSFDAHTFNVVSAKGAKPIFKGAMLRYSPEAAAKANKENEWTVIEAGKSVVVEHNLATTYNFTTVGEGHFRFSPVSNIFYHMREDGSLGTIEAKVEKFGEASLTGKLALSRAAPSQFEKRTGYQSCSSSQQSGVNAGVSAGQGLVSNSISWLSSHPSGGSRYTYWFGTYSSSRFSTVSTIFNNLNNKFSTWTYDCSCTESGTYAYVYPDSYGVVYVCTLFFNVPNGGADSKADTLVHEGSHFTKIGGTDDIVYGQSGAHSLATSQPSNAIWNADNYAYFASNPTGAS